MKTIDDFFSEADRGDGIPCKENCGLCNLIFANMLEAIQKKELKVTKEVVECIKKPEWKAELAKAVCLAVA